MHDTHNFAHPHHNVAAIGIEPGMVVADFGSGSGAYTLAAAEALKGSGQVYAIDIQKDLLRRTQNDATHRKLPIVETIWADLEVPGASNIKDEYTDRVIVSNLLFQVPDKVAILREARRVLRPNGRIAVIDWSESFGGLGPQKGDVVTKEAALAVADRAGLELDCEFAAGAHHYGLLLKLRTKN